MKFIRPEPQEWRAISSVTHSTGWQEVDKMIEREITRLYETLVVAKDPVLIHQTQGKVMALQEIRSFPAALAKMTDKVRL